MAKQPWRKHFAFKVVSKSNGFILTPNLHLGRHKHKAVTCAVILDLGFQIQACASKGMLKSILVTL